jgi:tRNA G18 (ribose-2'-O)-methylase SpoU
MSGYFAIGVCHSKTHTNVGTLMRSAACFGASFVFTVGRRYDRQATDVFNTRKHVPLFHYLTIDDLVKNLPIGCRLVGIDCNVEDKLSRPVNDLTMYTHQGSCAYLLGAEDHGLTDAELRACHELVTIPMHHPAISGTPSLNVAAAGTIVMYDRLVKSCTVTKQ